jgi:hypothetical protein
MMNTLSAMAHMGRAAQRQLFFFTLVMRFRGASFTATDLLSRFNINLSSTSYRRYLRIYIERQQSIVK